MNTQCNKKDEEINYLGYYAMDKKNNLYQFHWGADDTFYIINPKNLKLKRANANDYEILNIAYITI